MIRRVFSALSNNVVLGLIAKPCRGRSNILCTSEPIIKAKSANFTSLVLGPISATKPPSQSITISKAAVFLEPKQTVLEQTRTVTKFSLQKGKRKTVKTVPKRFFRLHWGIWVRRMQGKSKLWAKKRARRARLMRHVFCNATQSTMLDKMVNRFWRKPKYYLDDPYAVYHKRENFPFTQKKPWRPEGVDYE